MMGQNFSPTRIALEVAVLVGLSFFAFFLEGFLPPGGTLHILQGLILVGMPAPWIFIFLYRLRPWRETEIGRALMTIMTVFAIYYTVAAYTVVGGERLPFPLRAILYLLIAYAVWRMVFANARSHKRALQRQRDRRASTIADLDHEPPTPQRRSTDL